MDPLARAAADLKERNYGSAIRTLELLTTQDPSNADAFRYLSQAHYHVGELARAAEAGQRYVALRPTDASGHHNVGVLLAQLGQKAAAERAFQAALSADPGHAKARRALHQLTAEGVPPEARADQPASPTPAARAGKAGTSPWVARIVAGLTVLASLAIVLWLFLPGGPANPGRPSQAPESAPHQITTPAAVQPSAAEPLPNQSPQPTPQVQPQPQPETKTPAPEPKKQPVGPLPDPKQPSKAVPAARNLWRQVWRTPRQVYWQQPQLQYPGPMTQMQQPRSTAGQAAAPGPAAEEGVATAQGAAAEGQTPKPQPAPRMTSPQPRPQPAQPKPEPQPKAREQPATPPVPQPLFSPQEAQQVTEAMDRAERQGIQGELGYLANWLRSDPACNDHEFWPILQTALATTGPSMAPQGLSIGAGEVMAIITNAPTNREAADRLEFYSRNLRSVLPQPVKVQIAQVLGQATSARQAYSLVDTVLRQGNVATSQQTADVLLEALLRAERIAAQRQAEQQAKSR